MVIFLPEKPAKLVKIYTEKTEWSKISRKKIYHVMKNCPKNKECATAPLHLQTGAILMKPRKDLNPSLVQQRL